MKQTRVVVTGIGLVTPLGSDIESVWSSILASKSGIISFSTPGDATPCKVAGVVLPEFLNGKFSSERDKKKMDSFIRYSCVAADSAIKDSNILDDPNVNRDRIGVVIGSGIGGLPKINQTSVSFEKKGFKGVSPFFVPSSLINLSSGFIAIQHHITGPNSSVVSACASGANAIADAVRLIRANEVDAVIAGGAEATVFDFGIAGFASMKALSTNFNEDPKRASRPWDKDRDGFVMGEGAGILIVEKYESAIKRGAKIYAEIAGYGLSCDAYHVVALESSGLGAKKAMNMALRMSELAPSQIDYINAHGTSTPSGDFIEAQAVKHVFGDHAYKLAVSSVKSSIGHLLGASGSVEAIFSILSIRDSVAPPTLNLDSPSEGCDLNFVPHIPQKKKIHYVMSNSFGFGGVNCSLIIKKV